MRFLTRKLVIFGFAVGLAVKASAFSLMGPVASWQTAGIGYNLGADVGGPMNLFEDYRVTVPLLTYGYDATFLNYFGSNGVAAVQAAMDIMNSVPAASAMSAGLTEFPQQAKGPVNATAASLLILDLKSVVLSTMMGQLGVASPERWTYSLRDRVVILNTTNYTVIQRNFDPVNWRPTNIINGVLYTYSIVEPIAPGNYADAVESRVSGNANNVSVASADGGGIGFLVPGEFFTSLTRDDYGALRFLLRFNNQNVETLEAGLTLAPFNSPYSLPSGTNASTNVPVATARRPGIDRVTFNPIAIDSLLNVTIRPVTNRFVDSFYQTNSPFALTNQTLERVTTTPDVLITAGDLSGGLFGGAVVSRTFAARWVNNSALPGNSVVGGAGIVSGPGVIPSASSNGLAIVITFNTLGPSRLNVTDALNRFVNERSPSTNAVWGYFDTTTIYSVFPDGLTIQDLERQLYGR